MAAPIGMRDYSWVRSELCLPEREIGRGAGGTVFWARHPSSSQRVAIKRMDRGPLSHDPKALHSFQKEVDIFSALSHPNIIRLLDVRMSEPTCYLLVMELADCELANEMKGGPLPEAECRFYFRQIVTAVAYCHSQGICHRDLKLENVMLMEDTVTVKVTDFGMGKNYQMHSGPKTHEVGSFAYMSPEVVGGRGEYEPTPADVWSLGVMLYVMSCCKYPFGGLPAGGAGSMADEARIRQAILSADARVQHPDFFQPAVLSEGLQHLIRGILVGDPARRATTAQMLAHPWLQDRTGEEAFAAPVGSLPSSSPQGGGGFGAGGAQMALDAEPGLAQQGAGVMAAAAAGEEAVAGVTAMEGGDSWVGAQYDWDLAPEYQSSADSFDYGGEAEGPCEDDLFDEDDGL